MEILSGMALGGMAATYGVLGIIWYIILVIADWKIFKKAGKPGWLSLIPVLNTFIVYKISWKGRMFLLMLLTMGGSKLCADMAGDNGGTLSIVAIFLAVISLLITLTVFYKLSKSFGHGLGFTLGLIFLNPLFTLILVFGKSKYIGPSGIPVNRA